MPALLLLIPALVLTQPTQPQPAPLAGPRLAATQRPATLVQYDLAGRLRRPEIAPEEAALALLDLDAQAKAAADAIIEGRAAALDRFVSENLLLLGQLDTAGKAGGKLDQFTLFMQLYEKLRPTLEQGPLDARIAAALPAPAAARFRALVNTYYTAAAQEIQEADAANGKKTPLRLAMLGERLRLVGEEIKRSYERQAAAGTLIADYLLADLDLTEAQRNTISRLKLDFLERTSFHPTEKQQQGFVAGAVAYLSEAQRARVIRKISGR